MPYRSHRYAVVIKTHITDQNGARVFRHTMRALDLEDAHRIAAALRYDSSAPVRDMYRRCDVCVEVYGPEGIMRVAIEDLHALIRAMQMAAETVEMDKTAAT